MDIKPKYFFIMSILNIVLPKYFFFFEVNIRTDKFRNLLTTKSFGVLGSTVVLEV